MAGDQQLLDRLVAGLVESITNAMRQSELADVLYALSLEYSGGGLSTYSWPLYETSRQAILAADLPGDALWAPSWADEYGLPADAPAEWGDRWLESCASYSAQLDDLYEQYMDGLKTWYPEFLVRNDELWQRVAWLLTRFDWDGVGVAVTDDFACIAFPVSCGSREVRAGLLNSLGSERFAELNRRGWLPEDLGPIPS